LGVLGHDISEGAEDIEQPLRLRVRLGAVFGDLDGVLNGGFVCLVGALNGK
jgi:hypothetical protein